MPVIDHSWYILKWIKLISNYPQFISIYPHKRRQEDEITSDPCLGRPGPSKEIVPETPKSTINEKTIDETQNYLLDGKFYNIVSVNKLKMIVSCQQYSKQIIAHSNSTGNLLRHYKVSFNNYKFIPVRLYLLIK